MLRDIATSAGKTIYWLACSAVIGHLADALHVTGGECVLSGFVSLLFANEMYDDICTYVKPTVIGGYTMLLCAPVLKRSLENLSEAVLESSPVTFSCAAGILIVPMMLQSSSTCSSRRRKQMTRKYDWIGKFAKKYALADTGKALFEWDAHRPEDLSTSDMVRILHTGLRPDFCVYEDPSELVYLSMLKGISYKCVWNSRDKTVGVWPLPESESPDTGGD